LLGIGVSDDFDLGLNIIKNLSVQLDAKLTCLKKY
jgi:hypothetical protein